MNLQITNLIIKQDALIKDALSAINKNTLGVCCIVDEQERVLGIVTDGDIRRALLKGLGLEHPVSDIMSQNFDYAYEGTAKEKIFDLLTEKVSFVPILDKQKRLVDYVIFKKRFRLPLAAPSLNGNELKYVTECVTSNWISSTGRFVAEFEKRFAEFCGTKYAVATCNGTTALHLALRVLDIQPGDEVIVPTMTFVATANAVTYCGAKPVFVDSEWDTWGMDPKKIEEAITPKTKAIIAVHLYGHPAKMDDIKNLCKKHKLFLIEDAAQAHGAEYKGEKIGSIGDIATFSFFGNKIITTGEGGMLTTNNLGYAQKADLLRNHGMLKERRYWHSVIGFNYRMTNLQAAIGLAQIERAEEIITKKLKIAGHYQKYLEGASGLVLPPKLDDVRNVYWLYSVLIKEDFGIGRDKLISELNQREIETRRFFYPIHMLPPYILEEGKCFPVAEELSLRGLSLPSYFDMSEENIEFICDTIKNLRER